jgi:hypothetical protein
MEREIINDNLESKDCACMNQAEKLHIFFASIWRGKFPTKKHIAVWSRPRHERSSGDIYEEKYIF